MNSTSRGDHTPSIAIIGCGLAGAAVAWQAIFRGWLVSVIDRSDSESCSKVAAGLVTPITGNRAAASWQWDQFFPIARSFYRNIEQTTGSRFWLEKPALRIFRSHEERTLFSDRWLSKSSVSSSLNSALPSVQPFDLSSNPSLNAPFSGVQMQPAARLETCQYLEATKTYLQQRDAYLVRDLDCDNDIEVYPRPRISGIEKPFDAIIFCQGFACRENHWFPDLPLHPARGDVLRIAAPTSFPTEHVIHHSAWMVPDGTTDLLLGATYDRKTLDGVVDGRKAVIEAREELISRFRELIAAPLRNVPLKILAHRAAVRPASYDRHPLIGGHKKHPSVFCLNGLGSKGSLMSPLLANALLDCVAGSTIPGPWDLNRKTL